MRRPPSKPAARSVALSQYANILEYDNAAVSYIMKAAAEERLATPKELKREKALPETALSGIGSGNVPRHHGTTTPAARSPIIGNYGDGLLDHGGTGEGLRGFLSSNNLSSSASVAERAGERGMSTERFARLESSSSLGPKRLNGDRNPEYGGGFGLNEWSLPAKSTSAFGSPGATPACPGKSSMPCSVFYEGPVAVPGGASVVADTALARPVVPPGFESHGLPYRSVEATAEAELFMIENEPSFLEGLGLELDGFGGFAAQTRTAVRPMASPAMHDGSNRNSADSLPDLAYHGGFPSPLPIAFTASTDLRRSERTESVVGAQATRHGDSAVGETGRENEDAIASSSVANKTLQPAKVTQPLPEVEKKPGERVPKKRSETSSEKLAEAKHEDRDDVVAPKEMDAEALRDAMSVFENNRQKSLAMAQTRAAGMMRKAKISEVNHSVSHGNLGSVIIEAGEASAPALVSPDVVMYINAFPELGGVGIRGAASTGSQRFLSPLTARDRKSAYPPKWLQPGTEVEFNPKLWIKPDEICLVAKQQALGVVRAQTQLTRPKTLAQPHQFELSLAEPDWNAKLPSVGPVGCHCALFSSRKDSAGQVDATNSSETFGETVKAGFKDNLVHLCLAKAHGHNSFEDLSEAFELLYWRLDAASRPDCGIEETCRLVTTLENFWVPPESASELRRRSHSQDPANAAGDDALSFAVAAYCGARVSDLVALDERGRQCVCRLWQRALEHPARVGLLAAFLATPGLLLYTLDRASSAMQLEVRNMLQAEAQQLWLHRTATGGGFEPLSRFCIAELLKTDLSSADRLFLYIILTWIAEANNPNLVDLFTSGLRACQGLDRNARHLLARNVLQPHRFGMISAVFNLKSCMVANTIDFDLGSTCLDYLTNQMMEFLFRSLTDRTML